MNKVRRDAVLASRGLTSAIEIKSAHPKFENNIKHAMKEARGRPVSKRPKRQQLYWIYKMVLNRQNFDYSFTDGFKYYLWKVKNCRGCPCRSSKTVKELKAPKRDQ